MQQVESQMRHSFHHLSIAIVYWLSRYLEIVFKSQACMNASFLVADDKHYGCSNRNHGIDIERAIRLFGIISELENKTIQDLVRHARTEILITRIILSWLCCFRYSHL